VRTRQAYPEHWAVTQNNLALAYSDRIRGERAENLEQLLPTSSRPWRFLPVSLPRAMGHDAEQRGEHLRQPHSGRPRRQPGAGHQPLPPGVEIFTRQAYPSSGP